MDTLALQSQGIAGADLRPSGSRQGLFLLPSTEVPAPRTGITELASSCSPPCWGISHPMEAGESRLGSRKGNSCVLASSGIGHSHFPARPSQPGAQHRSDTSQEQQGGQRRKGQVGVLSPQPLPPAFS